jgi:hypothetical protein
MLIKSMEEQQNHWYYIHQYKSQCIQLNKNIKLTDLQIQELIYKYQQLQIKNEVSIYIKNIILL